MFNKREQSQTGSTDSQPPRREPRASASARPGPANTAVIGPSIQIDGTLRGDEDLVIEGQVKGTVELKKNSVTIGAQGNVQADIHAHTIFVDGTMDGNLVASERVVIRQSARIKGSIVSPRVSLEDGARFNGSIDMDPESEALMRAFTGGKKDATKTSSPSHPPAKPANGATGEKSPAAGSDKPAPNA